MNKEGPCACVKRIMNVDETRLDKTRLDETGIDEMSITGIR